MKQYVLDEPMAAGPPPPVEGQTPSLVPPGWWRWLVLAILLEAIALAVLYVAVNGVPGALRAEPSPGIQTARATVSPPTPESKIPIGASVTRFKLRRVGAVAARPTRPRRRRPSRL